jgi:hypothetical protein
MIFVLFPIKLWFFIEQRRHLKHISDGEYMCDKISCLQSYFYNFFWRCYSLLCHPATALLSGRDWGEGEPFVPPCYSPPIWEGCERGGSLFCHPATALLSGRDVRGYLFCHPATALLSLEGYEGGCLFCHPATSLPISATQLQPSYLRGR